jgi:cell division protein ZapA (FtsZ GTPase activity inhibitor)
MLLTIPYQLLEISNIQLENFKADHKGRIIAPLKYSTPSIQFHDISILTAPLTINDYDQTSNRIRFDIKSQTAFMNKMQAIQDSFVNKFYKSRFDILKYDASIEDIRSMFQFLFYSNMLTLFVFPNTGVKLANNTTTTVGQLKKGDIIRCVIRIHGISMLPARTGEFFPRFRIQHSVPTVYRVMTATESAPKASPTASTAIETVM